MFANVHSLAGDQYCKSWWQLDEQHLPERGLPRTDFIMAIECTWGSVVWLGVGSFTPDCKQTPWDAVVCYRRLLAGEPNMQGVEGVFPCMVHVVFMEAWVAWMSASRTPQSGMACCCMDMMVMASGSGHCQMSHGHDGRGQWPVGWALVTFS